MASKFLGQIMMTGFNFAPKNFAFCNGQLLAIAQNQALFSLLGTTYGGNGTTNFQLPNLQTRTPVGYGSSMTGTPSPTQLGEVGGASAVTLLTGQIPQHNHMVGGAVANGTVRNPNGALYATSGANLYAAPGSLVALAGSTIAPTGGTQPHQNMQPYLAIPFCISLVGIYPSRN